MSRRSSTIRSIAILVILGVLALLVWGYMSLTRDPYHAATQQATKQLYKDVAYNAASIQGSVDTRPTAQQLIDGIAMTHYRAGYIAAGQVSPSGQSVTWVAELTGKGFKTAFLSNADVRLRACVAYTAQLALHSVEVVPIDCSAAEKDPGFDRNYAATDKEIKLDTTKIKQARDDRPRTLQCQAIGEGRSVCE